MNPKNLALIIVSLGVAACGQGLADDELAPGEWKMTITMSDFELPGATPEQAALFSSSAPDPMSETMCIAAGENKFEPEMMTSAFQQSGDCETSDFGIAGGKVSGKLVCDAGQDQPAESEISGNFGPEAFSISVSTELLQEAFPEGRATVKVEMSGERIGDC